MGVKEIWKSRSLYLAIHNRTAANSTVNLRTKGTFGTISIHCRVLCREVVLFSEGQNN